MFSVRPEEQRRVLYFSLVLIALISYLNALAIKSHFYWLYWWFDILMHFLGGFWVALFFLWVYLYTGFFGLNNGYNLKKIRIFLFSLLAVLVAALIWEVFEFFVHQTFKEPNFLTDTSSDIVLGLMGGGLAYRYFVFNFLKKNGK